MSGEGNGWSLGQVRVVELALSSGVNNLCTLAVEKKAEKEKTVQSKCNIKSCMFEESPTFSYCSVPQTEQIAG
jgi:hypothetical protein